MFRFEWVILREYFEPSQKLPLIISFLRYTFGAAEACFEVLGYVRIFLLMRILCCCACTTAQDTHQQENKDIT